MAVSSAYTWNPDFAGLVKMAQRTAGVLGPHEETSGEELQMAGEWVNATLKEWQAAGRLLRQVERVTETLTSGTATVPGIDADTIDIEFPAYLTLTTGTATYEVDRMTMDEYLRISNKTESGIPSRALVERKDTVVMTLHPVPNSTVASISYARVRLIRDLTAGTTADLHQRYLKALMLSLAVFFAESAGKSADKIDRLERRAEQAKADVMKDNTERGSIRFVLR